MSISEAIRRGEFEVNALGLRQITGDYITTEGCCAAGMAFLGHGISGETISGVFDEAELYPEIADPIAYDLLPEAVKAFSGVHSDPAAISLIIQLNDPPFNWPASQIADYFESIGR